MCPLTSTKKTVPSSVSIVAHPKDPPTNLMMVINNFNDTSGTVVQNRFGICVKPLHFDYNRVREPTKPLYTDTDSIIHTHRFDYILIQI